MSPADRYLHRALVGPNRMTRMRMRDQSRWVNRYREAAYQAALAESRTRGFFASLMYAVTQMAQYRSSERPR